MKILIVDGNLESAQRVSQRLNGAGNESKAVASKSQCYDALAADQYDLLLTHCRLPGSSALTLLEEFTQKGIHLPVVVLTAPGDEERALEAMENGAYDYIIRDTNDDYLTLLPTVVEEAHRRYMLTEENLRYREELSRTEPATFSSSSLMNIRYEDELKRLNRQLADMATSDGLTGLYNRRQLELDLEAELDRTDRYDYPLTCLMIDIDYFKRINDTHGQHVGDFILRELGQLLLEGRRKTDSFYRHGSDAFLVLMPHTSLDGGERFANRLLHRVRYHVFEIEDLSLQITVSMGLATYQRGMIDTRDLLLRCAEDALYEAKKAGRDRISIWQTEGLPQ